MNHRTAKLLELVYVVGWIGALLVSGCVFFCVLYDELVCAARAYRWARRDFRDAKRPAELEPELGAPEPERQLETPADIPAAGELAEPIPFPSRGAEPAGTTV